MFSLYYELNLLSKGKKLGLMPNLDICYFFKKHMHTPNQIISNKFLKSKLWILCLINNFKLMKIYPCFWCSRVSEIII